MVTVLLYLRMAVVKYKRNWYKHLSGPTYLFKYLNLCKYEKDLLMI